MLPADILTVSEQHLSALVENEVSENDTLEYKSQLNLATPEAKLEFLKDISALANAKGGDLVFGVKEDNEHRPVELTSQTDFNFDEWQRRVMDVCTSHLEPRLLGLQFREISLARGGSAFVIRVPRPWAGPYMVKLKDENRFYVRVGNQKKVMSVPELRSAFVLQEAVANRMRNFRTERLAKIMIHETPVATLQTAYVVLHVFPLAAFTQTTEVDLQKLRNASGRTAPIHNSGGWSPSFNFDGFITQSSNADKRCNSYLQVFRNGCLEAVDNVLLYPHEGHKNFVTADEAAIADATKRFIGILYELYVDPPFFAMLSYLNVRDYTIYQEMPSFGANAIDRDHLIFPEAMVSDHEADCFSVFKRSFDMLWQACGYDYCPNYDKQGNRKSNRRG